VDNDDLADIIVEIFDGFSVLDSSLGPIYIKHFHQLDTRKILGKRKLYIAQAEERGLLTENSILKMLFQDGMWDDKSEKKIQEKKKFIENLKNSISKIVLPSKRKEHKKLIDLEISKLNALSLEREKLIGLTAEKYAEKKVNKEFFESLLFLDDAFKTSPFEDLDYQDIKTAKELTDLEGKFFNRMNDENISKAVLSPFFSPYMPYSEDVLNMFGEPLKNLTAFQLKMISYARSFLNIFKNSQKEIPDHIAKDPDLLIDFYNSQKTENNAKNKGESDATTYFGANRNDIEQLKNNDQEAIILTDEIKKKGGSLNMKDMMDLHGL
jgi:hypothetical protein